MPYLKLRDKYVGVSPRAEPGQTGDAAYPVYANRDKGGGWEEVEITQTGPRFFVKFKEANRTLSMTPEGEMQTRAAGTTGPWEAFFATTQPDNINLLYRRGEDAARSLVIPVLEIQS